MAMPVCGFAGAVRVVITPTAFGVSLREKGLAAWRCAFALHFLTDPPCRASGHRNTGFRNTGFRTAKAAKAAKDKKEGFSLKTEMNLNRRKQREQRFKSLSLKLPPAFNSCG